VRTESAIATLLRFLARPSVVACAYVLISIGAAFQRYALGPNVVDGHTYTHYNNYVIFKDSFGHLLHGQDLYVAFPDEHWDLYKYSPTFALLMWPFALLPDLAGLAVWNVLGSIALFIGIWQLPIANARWRMAAAWFLVLPMLQSLQNAQSNAHVAGLVLLAAAWLEAGGAAWAALAIALGFFVKVYGAVALAIAVMYPERLKCGAWCALWLVGLGLLPLALVSASHLLGLYESWGRLMAADQAAHTGVSVMGLVENWSGISTPKTVVGFAGLALTLLPLVRIRAYSSRHFRMVFLAALLVWMVIFNHKAEPNTFVIAVAGAAVWYLVQPNTPLRNSLAVLVFVLTCLSTTTVFPTVLRRSLIQPYSLRVFPCLLVWLAAIVELWSVSGESNPEGRIVRG
jgi:hypothetical protein